MLYLFFALGLYCLLVSLWVFSDAPKFAKSRLLWPIGTFFIPLFVPLYLFKTRPKIKWRYIGLWVLGFYLSYTIVDTLTDVTAGKEDDQITSLSETAKSSTINFQKSLEKLDGQRGTNTVSEFERALGLVVAATNEMTASNQAIEMFIAHIDGNRRKLVEDGLDRYILMQEMYKTLLMTYRKRAEEYLSVYREWLEFSRDNYDAIVGRNEPQSTIYEELFAGYEKALEKHTRAYSERHAFLVDYADRHPQLADTVNALSKGKLESG